MTDSELTRLHEALQPLAPKGRTALLPALHAAQNILGFVPESAAGEIARILRLPLAEVHGVLEFYALFERAPSDAPVVHLCEDPACALAGAAQLAPGLESSARVRHSPCLGLCDQVPALLVAGRPRGSVDPSRYNRLTPSIGRETHSTLGSIGWLLTRCGLGRATTLAEYETSGGYQALRKAVALGPAAVIEEVKQSGLVGRGGAAFPTGQKWEGAASAPGTQRYVVCNGDEAEPGTFKDRVLMEEDPHSVLEGLLIAAVAIHATRGYLFVRGEYPRAFEALSRAVVEARDAGHLSASRLGFELELEVRSGAGAYVCGEETALFEAIEGRRGLPRVKPPFPTSSGLFGAPTALNNVETLANVPHILSLGAATYRAVGTARSTGTKLFCLSGDVARPGLYEVAFGVTLRHLLHDLAGGIREARRAKAILLGGAAGAFATEAELDVRLSFEDLRAAGLPLGSGVVMVFDETRDLRDVLLRLGRFFAHESCGKCFPCQIGTQRQLEVLTRLAAGRTLPGDLQRLTDLGRTMTDASLCGLGQTAASATLSAIGRWPSLFESR